MMTPKTQTIVASTTIGLTASIALALIPYKPDATAAVLVTLGMFVVVWNAVQRLIKLRNPGIDWYTSNCRHKILFSIILASLLLLGSLIATIAKQLELLDQELIKRFIGINTGLMLIVLGNYMPKRSFEDAKERGCCTSKHGSNNIQRFMGWTFVIGGLLYAGAWIFFDLDKAGIVIMFAFPAAIVIIVALRFLFLRVSGTKNQLEQSV